MNLSHFTLLKIDQNNKEHLSFLRQLFLDETVKKYLSGLNKYIGENDYILYNGNEKIGYVSLTKPLLNHFQSITTTIYYAIDKKHRGNHYAQQLLLDLEEHLKDKIDQFVVQISRYNKASLAVASNAGFKIVFDDISDEMIVLNKEITNKKNRK